MAKNAAEEEKFLLWLFENQNTIKDGGAVYEGERVTMKSLAVRYETCCSIIFMTMRKKTPMFLKDSSRARKSQITASIVSYIFGWWGIPFGLIFTPVVVMNNIRNAGAIPVEELFKQFADTNYKPPDENFFVKLGFYALSYVGAFASLFALTSVASMFK